MVEGTVIRFNPDKHYGFARPDGGGEDVLVHESALCRGENVFGLRPGARISFESASTPKGMRAVNIRVWLDGQDDDGPVPAAQFRDEISEVLAGAVSRIEGIARKYGRVI